jgi:HSP20 family protein
MSGSYLQPQYGNRSMMRQSGNQSGNGDGFGPLRSQMNRLFDDFFGGFPGLPMMPPSPMMAAVVVAPRIEVSETDKELQITAELPGIDPKNVEVTLEDDVLTIRGEKEAQKEEGEDRDYHLTERSYGTFVRYLRLPFRADPQQVRASFKDGVLTLTIPKPDECQQGAHRIEVKADRQPADGSQQTANGSQQSADGAQQGGNGSQQAGNSAQQQQPAAAQ